MLYKGITKIQNKNNDGICETPLYHFTNYITFGRFQFILELHVFEGREALTYYPTELANQVSDEHLPKGPKILMMWVTEISRV